MREYRELLAGLPVEITYLDELGITQEVEETGHTFYENALQKARAYAQISGLPTWADDSGLEVDALNGAPGVRSARYAGPGATDEDRCRLLLQQLTHVPPEERTARFRCVVAIVWPDGRQVTTEGQCEGLIVASPRGENGFGYDPVFYLPEKGRTMAELTPKEKNAISHRGQAARRARVKLDAVLTPEEAQNQVEKQGKNPC